MATIPRCNYPNHPLFRIAPLLDKGFQTVLHDEYTSRLVGRIRARRYMPELWDCNSLYLGYSERLAAVRAPRPAFKSRYTMTAEQRKAWANGNGDPEVRAERERRRAEQAERDAEKARVWAENEKRRKQAEEERERRTREWVEEEARLLAEQAKRRNRVEAETEQFLTERAWIMTGSWECAQCLTPSKITALPAGRYALSCRNCERRAVADHATMLNAMNARNARLEPVNSG
jgi:hypothetical protein